MRRFQRILLEAKASQRRRPRGETLCGPILQPIGRAVDPAAVERLLESLLAEPGHWTRRLDCTACATEVRERLVQELRRRDLPVLSLPPEHVHAAPPERPAGRPSQGAEPRESPS